MKPIDPTTLTKAELETWAGNMLRHGATDSANYLAALAELGKRKGRGLDFNTSMRIIRQAATERKFVGYKDLADASGAVWGEVHWAMNAHLGDLVYYSHLKGWPLLSAIVVNQKHRLTGTMDPSALEGFIKIAQELKYPVTDRERFLREQQEKVFKWAKQAEPP